MKKNFLEILLKPLKYDNLIPTIIKFLLLILPSGIAAYFLGPLHWIFIVLTDVAFIVLVGYFLEIFKMEVEGLEEKYPIKSFLECFFVGIKGLLFYQLYLVLLGLILYGLHFVFLNFPVLYNELLIIAILLILIWLFMVYPIALGLFSDKFNPLHALEVGTLIEIAISSWWAFIVAFVNMFLYTLIIGLLAFGILFVSKYALTFTVICSLSLLGLYLITLYCFLYANVYRKLRNEFESHI